MPGPSVPAVSAPCGGWHWKEWACELAGTALLLLGGLSAVCLDFGRGSPVAAGIPSVSIRLLITGLLFAGSGSLVAVTPMGRLSGAHLNPVITLAFWAQRTVRVRDLVGYICAQLVGAVLGAAVVLGLWGAVARSVRVGATSPGAGVSGLSAVMIEAAMTATLVLTILLMTSDARTARWTPFVVWLLVAALVWQGAPYTGTSLNPARSLGPALLAPALHHLGIYVAGPLLGAALAVGLFGLMRERRSLTAKLFHDSRYPSILGHSLRAAAHLHRQE